MPRGDEGRAADGGEEDEVDVLGDQVRDPGDVGDEVSDHREAETPEERADEVVQRVATPRHVADARGDRREGADDRDEPSENDRQPAVALEERVRALDVLSTEQPRFLAFEHRGAAPMSDEVPDFAARERGQGDEGAHDPDVDAEDVVRVGEKARDDEERVTGEQEPDEQARLGEDDEADDGERPRPRRADDVLGIEPRDEGQRVHEGPIGLQGRGLRFRRFERSLSGPESPLCDLHLCAILRATLCATACGIALCGRWDLNPHARRHRNLNPACLPISPLPRGVLSLSGRSRASRSRS